MLRAGYRRDTSGLQLRDRDYLVLRGQDLRDLKGLLSQTPFSGVCAPQANSLLVLTESGFYKMAMRSDRPEAEELQDFVCEELLPSVRRHGCYPPPGANKPLGQNASMVTDSLAAMTEARRNLAAAYSTGRVSRDQAARAHVDLLRVAAASLGLDLSYVKPQRLQEVPAQLHLLRPADEDAGDEESSS